MINIQRLTIRMYTLLFRLVPYAFRKNDLMHLSVFPEGLCVFHYPVFKEAQTCCVYARDERHQDHWEKVWEGRC